LKLKFEEKQILYAFFFPALLLVVIGLVWILEKGLDADWHRLGIYPRSEEGLWGILTGPFIHSGSSHIFSNSAPILVLGWCLFYFYKDLGYLVFPLLWILSGIFTWCIGRDSWHIGASCLIYAMAFFLFFSGIFRRYIPLTAVSLIVVFLYGSIIWNMFPVAELVDYSISWEGHLSGAISGLICAAIFRKEGPQKPEETDEDEEEEEECDRYEDE
jgi:membrane associated rhomboid family serine protease